MVNFSSYDAQKTIDFISLYDLMNELVGELNRDEPNESLNETEKRLHMSNQRAIEAHQHSRVAKKLYRDLRNKTNPPQWGEDGGESDPDFADTDKIADEGMAMLKHIIGLGKRMSKAHCHYVMELSIAEKCGIDESLILPEINQADLMYKGADFLRAREIGFDRQEIAIFLGCDTQPKPEIESDADQPTELESVKSGATGKQESEATKKWKKEARAIGEEWMLAEEERTGERPGVIAISRYVEGELSNRKITGPRGRFLDAGTIKREALKGITGRKANGK